MSGHVKAVDHCKPPKGFFAKRRHLRTPWVCDCGKAWLSRRQVHSSYAESIATWTWHEWKPA